MHFPGKLNPSAAYTGEVIYLYAAAGLEPGDMDPDEDEDLEVIEYDFREAYHMAGSGKLVDAKTAAAFLWQKNSWI